MTGTKKNYTNFNVKEKWNVQFIRYPGYHDEAVEDFSINKKDHTAKYSYS